jgi:hypothetical protein
LQHTNQDKTLKRGSANVIEDALPLINSQNHTRTLDIPQEISLDSAVLNRCCVQVTTDDANAESKIGNEFEALKEIEEGKPSKHPELRKTFSILPTADYERKIKLSETMQLWIFSKDIQMQSITFRLIFHKM